MNGSNRSHKYLYKYRGKNGQYVYVYDNKVTQSKDPKVNIKSNDVTNGVSKYWNNRITKYKTEVYGPITGKKNIGQGDISSITIEKGKDAISHYSTYKVSILLKDGSKAVIERGKEYVDKEAKEYTGNPDNNKKTNSNSSLKRSTYNKRKNYIHNKMKDKKTAIKVRRNTSKSFHKEQAYNVSKTNW